MKHLLTINTLKAKISLLLLILILFSILSSFNNLGKRKINFIIESDANYKNINVTFDNKNVYNSKQIITEPSTGTAGYFFVNTREGIHKIVFNVDNFNSKTFIFSTDTCINDTLYFGLNINHNDLNVIYYKKRPLYD